MCGQQQAGGRWSAAERRLHINALEQSAGSLAVQTFARNCRDSHVLIQMDNRVAMSYVNMMGGAHSVVLSWLARDLWTLCLARNITLCAEYLPGNLNDEADFWSRNHSSAEWELHPAAFALMQPHFRPSEVDLFATRLNAQVPHYVSWRPEPSSFATDAFTVDWGEVDSCAFPPFALLARCLQRVRGQRVPSLRGSGFSQGVSTLLLNSWRPTSARHYDSAWTQWDRRCRGRAVNPLRPRITNILEFLTSQFQAEKAYRTIAGYQSALSSTLPSLEGVSVGQHPLVCRLMKGVYHQRPPLPRYAATWDVEHVLELLQTWHPPEQLSVDRLTWKLTMLLALAGAKRTVELRNLSAAGCTLSSNGATLTVGAPTKTQRTGSALKRVTFPRFHDPRLCPVGYLEAYLRRSASWRSESEHPQLLRSTRRPHGPVSTSMVARWILRVLANAGIDTAVFKAHSKRGAATSAATQAGCSLEVVLAEADWRRSSTFHQFYRREVPTVQRVGQFSESVLSSADGARSARE